MSKEVTISYFGERYGEWFVVSPLTFAAADQLLLGLDKSEIESGLAIGDTPKNPTKIDEFLFAVRIRARNDNISLLEYLNSYFRVSLPGLESRWEQVCISKN